MLFGTTENRSHHMVHDSADKQVWIYVSAAPDLMGPNIMLDHGLNNGYCDCLNTSHSSKLWLFRISQNWDMKP